MPRADSTTVVSVEWPEDDVAVVTIDSPPANQLNGSGRAQLCGALSELAGHDRLGALVLKGARGRFSAGNDIRELETLRPDQRESFAAEWDNVYARIRDFPVPTVAVVEGYAYGGGFEMMLNCDLRIVAADAELACTAARLGVVTSTYSLARQVGWAVARELYYTSRSLDAAEALKLGIANEVVPAAELSTASLELARRIAAQPSQAIRRSKELFADALVLDRAEHDVLQREAFAALADTPEHHRAVAEFLNRKPRGDGDDGAAKDDGS